VCCIATKWFGDISQYIADYSDVFLPDSAFIRKAIIVPLWSVAAAIGLRAPSAAVLRMTVFSQIDEALLTEEGRQSNDWPGRTALISHGLGTASFMIRKLTLPLKISSDRIGSSAAAQHRIAAIGSPR